MKTQNTKSNARRLLNTVTASLCPVLLACAAIVLAPGTGISQATDPVGPPKPVQIINTDAQPVPVKGSVEVKGNVNLAPGTKVGIEGTANVNLVDKTVIVANSELEPVLVRDIQKKLTTPIQAGGGENIIFDEPQTQSAVMYTVPAGKRLVIEFIAADMSLDSDVDDALLYITTNLGGVGSTFPLALVPLNDEKRFGFTGLTKIYADAGTDVTLTFQIFDEASAINAASIRFAGYLVDL